MTFQTWVRELIEQRFGTATKLAATIEMQLSPFTRGVAAGTLNLVNLLKLAKAAEENPSTVLRLADKGEEANLIEELYGSGRDALTQSQRELIEVWEQIPAVVRKHLFVILQHARDVAAHTHPGRNAGPPESTRPPRRGSSRRAEAHPG